MILNIPTDRSGQTLISAYTEGTIGGPHGQVIKDANL